MYRILYMVCCIHCILWYFTYTILYVEGSVQQRSSDSCLLGRISARSASSLMVPPAASPATPSPPTAPGTQAGLEFIALGVQVSGWSGRSMFWIFLNNAWLWHFLQKFCPRRLQISRWLTMCQRVWGLLVLASLKWAYTWLFVKSLMEGGIPSSWRAAAWRSKANLHPLIMVFDQRWSAWLYFQHLDIWEDPKSRSPTSGLQNSYGVDYRTLRGSACWIRQRVWVSFACFAACRRA